MRHSRLMATAVFVAVLSVGFLFAGFSAADHTGQPRGAENRDLGNGGRSFSELIQADSVTTDELAVIASATGSPGYYMALDAVQVDEESVLLVIGTLTTESGRQYHFGDMAPVDEKIVSGLIQNISHVNAQVSWDQYNGASVPLESGEMISIGEFVSDAILAAPPPGPGQLDCSVTCGSGFYACCMYGTVYPQCKCVKNNSTVNCDSGGAGSAHCALSQPSPQGPSGPAPKTELGNEAPPGKMSD